MRTKGQKNTSEKLTFNIRNLLLWLKSFSSSRASSTLVFTVDISKTYIIQELNGSQFAGMDNLRHLNLGRNKINKINRNVFVGAYRLQAIFLDHNRIQSIHPITFRGLASLKLLSLEGNQIKSIHPTTFITLVLGNWIPFSSLQIIKLNNNALEVNLPRSGFRRLLVESSYSVVSFYDLRFCIQRLDEDTFRHTHQLQSLTLHNNLWDCSCKTSWFNDFINQYPAVKCPQV